MVLLDDADFATLIPAKNVERAIKFYTEKLGGTLNMKAEGDMKDTWASINIGENEFWLSKPEKVENRELAYSTFMVDDIRKTVKELESKGVTFEPAEMMSESDVKTEGPITITPHGSAVFFKDTEGNLLMVWEGPKD
jgi:predicted enzyme related to lactoylglutathione lyase